MEAALESGELDAKRFDAYQRLQREMAYTERRQSENYAYEERKRGKEFGKMYKRILSEKKNRR